MGTFHTKCKIENPTDRTRSVVIPKLLVDSGNEYTWVSERSLERIGVSREKKDVAFVLANGQEDLTNRGPDSLLVNGAIGSLAIWLGRASADAAGRLIISCWFIQDRLFSFVVDEKKNGKSAWREMPAPLPL